MKERQSEVEFIRFPYEKKNWKPFFHFYNFFIPETSSHKKKLEICRRGWKLWKKKENIIMETKIDHLNYNENGEMSDLF